MTNQIKVFSLIVVLQVLSTVTFAGEVIRLKNQTLMFPQRSMSFPTGKMGPRFLPVDDKVYYLVQFIGPVRTQWKNELAAQGVELNSYIPDDAFIAKIQSPQAWQALNGSVYVKTVIEYDPKFRMSEEFQTPSVFNKGQVQKILLRLTNGGEFAGLVSRVKALGLKVSGGPISEKILLLETPTENLEKLAALDGVEWVEPLKEIRTMEYDISASISKNPAKPGRRVAGDYSDLTGFESGTKLMNFDGAYARGFHGEGEVVGIADTGVDRGSTTTVLTDFQRQINKGYIKGLFSKGWHDPQGHGTHTAGSIVGTGASSGGILHGGAYGAKLVAEGLWSPMLNNIAINPDFEDVFGSLRQNDDVHVHSDSWGSPQNPGAYDNMASLVDEVSWNHPDLLLVFAAGNDGKDDDADGHIDEGSIGTPATAKNCLSVGASKNLVLVGGYQKKMQDMKDKVTGKSHWPAEPIASSMLSDNPSGMAGFSSIGPTKDGRIKPDIVAPGTNIISTRSQYPNATALWGPYNDLYSYAGGTSMATPLTAGAAAVTRQFLRSAGFSDPSSALIKAVLIHTATDLYPGQFGLGAGQEFKTKRPNVNEGYGRVDLALATSLNKGSLVDETPGLATGESKQYAFQVTAGQKVEVTMVYTDAPASAGAAAALVNDLDVAVVDGLGTVYYPNHLNGPDRKNNSEMIEFVAPQAGTYTVKVTGANVPKGRDTTGAQPYALVVTAN